MEKSSEFHPTYTVLPTSESEKQRHIYPTHEAKIKEAERLKSEGNALFKQQLYKPAMSCYHKVFFMLNSILDPTDAMAQYTPKTHEKATEGTLYIVKALKANTYLNMAQIDLFNKNYEKAVDRASKSLEIEESVKGLYRRGCAYIELNELEKAKKDLERVRELEASIQGNKNEDLEEKFAIIKNKQKIVDNGLKEKLKKMFI